MPPYREVEEFLDYKERQNEYSPASRESKQYALFEFAEFINTRDVAAIKTPDIERYYRHLQQRVSESRRKVTSRRSAVSLIVR